jgi:hypothetical protein
MTTARKNQSRLKIGKGRGVPIAALRAIARKYDLTHFVAYVRDRQARSRILYWARNDLGAMACAKYCQELALGAGWQASIDEFDCSSVRRMKDRIRELETALAQIVDGVENPVALARSAGKFPDESEGENLGEWIFFPSGKLSRPIRAEQQSAAAASYNVLTREQLGAESIKDLAYFTWRKLVSLNFGNVAGELEVAIAHAVRRFQGYPDKRRK